MWTTPVLAGWGMDAAAPLFSRPEMGAGRGPVPLALATPRINNSVVDDAHRRLAVKAAIVQALWRADEPVALVADALDNFITAAADHFRMEEVVAAGAGLPGLAEHRIEHQAVLQRLRRLLRRVKAGDVVDVGGAIEQDFFDHEVVADTLFLGGLRDLQQDINKEGDLLVWSEDWSVGDAEMDDMHRQIVRLLNQLYAVARQGDPAGELPVLFAALMNETMRHFAFEEQKLYRKPEDLRAHIQEHRLLFFDLSFLIGEDIDAVVLESVCRDYLRFWFLSHMITRDHPDFSGENPNLPQ